MSSTRTSSPYFSPNSIIAPDFCASSIAITRACVARVGQDLGVDHAPRRARSARRVSGALWAKSKRVRSALTSEPFCCTCAPSTSRSALCIRCVALWLRTVLRAALGVDARDDASPTATAPSTTRPWWPCTAAWTLTVSSTTTRARRVAQLAGVADLAAALGVERRVVEHDDDVVAGAGAVDRRCRRRRSR